MNEMVAKRGLPLDFDVIRYPSYQCTGAAQSDTRAQDLGWGKQVLYIRTRVSDSNKSRL